MPTEGKVILFGDGSSFRRNSIYANAAKNWATKVVFEKSFRSVSPVNCEFWFNGFGRLEEIRGLEYLNTSQATSMASMFYGCKALKSLNLSNFDTRAVTTMEKMFCGCDAVEELDLSNFETNNVTNMCQMMEGCDKLERILIPKFTVANNLRVTGMFSNCPLLTTIYTGEGFDLSTYSDKLDEKSTDIFMTSSSLLGAAPYNINRTGVEQANYKTGYFTRIYYRAGDRCFGRVGETAESNSVPSLMLVDGQDFVAYVDFDVQEASCSREMKGQWGTLCLPYAFATSSVAGFKFYRLAELTEGALILSEINDDNIAAGTPVIIRRTGENAIANIQVTDVQVVQQAGTDGMLVGTFVQTELSNDDYIVSGDCFWQASELIAGTNRSVWARGQRAYICAENVTSGARSLNILLNDEANVIDHLNAVDEGQVECYDLAGRRLECLQRGINVVHRNGKTVKIMIK